MLNYEPNDIVNLFKTKCKDRYIYMTRMGHDYEGFKENRKSLSKYHAEGSVWAHTASVLTNLISKGVRPSIELFLATLLHDAGKLVTKVKKEVFVETHSYYKFIFHNHAAIGVSKP